MTLELLCNFVLLVFFAYCFAALETLPDARAGEMSSKAWPQALLGLLIFFICIHIIQTWRKGRAEGKFFKIDIASVKDILTLKLIIGMALSLACPIALNYAGFLPTMAIFIFSYMTLLGEKKWRTKILISIFITALLYVIFHIFLQVPLPRGVGIFREMALKLEILLQ